MPQPPQLFGSLCSSTQNCSGEPHTSGVAAGHAPHAPAAHEAPTGHTVHEGPQLNGSVLMLVHTPHVVEFGGLHIAVHVPLPLQISPVAVQSFAHVPQCELLVLRSTHVPLQFV